MDRPPSLCRCLPPYAPTARTPPGSGGLELARVSGAHYLVPDGASVSFARTPAADGDTVAVDEDLVLRAVATPGHTPHHTSYVLEEDGRPVAAFTGGSLLIGTVGPPDLVEPRLTERLARAQHASAHRLANELDDEVAVLPTHGFGSFCSSAQAEGDAITIGAERKNNDALTKDWIRSSRSCSPDWTTYPRTTRTWAR